MLPSFAFAQLGPAETGVSATGVAAYGSTAPDLSTYIGAKILAPAFSVIGIIFLLLIVYAGFLWMTAAGNTSQVEKAKNIMVSAIIGTVIALAAFAITTFVFQNLATVPTTP